MSLGRYFCVFRKIKDITTAQLSQGLSLHDSRIAISMALTIGIFPIMGLSTPINFICCHFFKLNQPIVQSLSWVVGPIKIVLILPFIRLGEWLFQAPPFKLSLQEFTRRFFDDAAATTYEFIWTFAHAISAWCLFAPIIYALLFCLLKPVVSRLSVTQT